MKTLQCRHYSEMKRWRHYNVFIFSLLHMTYLYNRKILAIIIIMSIYSDIVVFETLGFWFATLHRYCRAANQNLRASNDNNALKMNIIVILIKVFPAGMDAFQMHLWDVSQCLRDISKRADLQISETSPRRLIKEVSSETSLRSLTQPTQRCRKDAVKAPYFWSQRRLRLVWNGSRNDLFLWHRQDFFQETSSRPFPEDVLKTSKTSSKLFLIKAREHLETNYGFFIYVRFKILTYYYPIIT